MKYFAAIVAGLVTLLGFSSFCPAQTDINLIDTPTASVLNKNSYNLNFRFYQEGGVLVQGTAGLTEKLTVGASYGGVGIVGTGPIKSNPEPAFSLKYKLGEEGGNLPFALSVGFDGQGYGKYYKEGEKIKWEGYEVTLKESFYQINSKGFYLALTKNLKDMNLLVTGGINHSLEENPGKVGISFFTGAKFEVTPKLVFALEYNNGFHKEVKPEDVFKESVSVKKPFRKAGGEINLGIKVRYSPSLILEIDFKDLSGRYTDNGNRTFQIIYSGEF